MKTRIQHLPADVHGLSAVARAGISSGSSFSPVPVIHRVLDIPRPAERLGVDERGVLADLVDRGLADAGIALAPAARDHLEALRSEGVPCVLTGQQPGFLTSPLYCLYKALQACKVAEELSAVWGTAVVPVFWNHADDHDIAEVHHAWQLTATWTCRRWASLASPPAGRRWESSRSATRPSDWTRSGPSCAAWSRSTGARTAPSTSSCPGMGSRWRGPSRGR